MQGMGFAFGHCLDSRTISFCINPIPTDQQKAGAVQSKGWQSICIVHVLGFVFGLKTITFSSNPIPNDRQKAGAEQSKGCNQYANRVQECRRESRNVREDERAP